MINQTHNEIEIRPLPGMALELRVGCLGAILTYQRGLEPELEEHLLQWIRLYVTPLADATRAHRNSFVVPQGPPIPSMMSPHPQQPQQVSQLGLPGPVIAPLPVQVSQPALPHSTYTMPSQNVSHVVPLPQAQQMAGGKNVSVVIPLQAGMQPQQMVERAKMEAEARALGVPVNPINHPVVQQVVQPIPPVMPVQAAPVPAQTAETEAPPPEPQADVQVPLPLDGGGVINPAILPK